MSNSMEQLPLPVSLDPEATWSQWVSRSVTNELEQAVTTAFVPGAPVALYVWGSAGTGKSHLLQAVCRQFELSARYLPLRSLLEYPPDAVLEAVETVDLVAFDDIDCIDANEQWQEQLFHVYNRCQISGTSMLFSAALAPAGLTAILPDLSSRLAACTVFQLPIWHIDDFERLLSNRAKAHGLSLSAEATRYLAIRLPRTGAAAAAAVAMIDQSSLAQKRSPTVPFLKTLALGI